MDWYYTFYRLQPKQLKQITVDTKLFWEMTFFSPALIEPIDSLKLNRRQFVFLERLNGSTYQEIANKIENAFYIKQTTLSNDYKAKNPIHSQMVRGIHMDACFKLRRIEKYQKKRLANEWKKALSQLYDCDTH